MSYSVSSSSSESGASRQPSTRSWTPAGIGHHESVESRGCVLTSLSDDRIISADAPSPWSPL